MKLQDLNRSFGKIPAACAIAFMIASAPARAQQGQWGSDGCFYALVFSAAVRGAQQDSVQAVRQGCAVQSTDGQARYYDLRTGQLYLMENNPSQQGSKVGKIFKALIAGHKQVLQALQARRSESAPMDPQAMQQAADSAPMIPQAMQQATYSPTMAPQAMQQGPNPYSGVSYAGRAPVASVQPGTCFNQANCLQAGGPNVPAGNFGLPSNGPAPALKLHSKQSRTKAIKAGTVPTCAASPANCQ